MVYAAFFFWLAEDAQIRIIIVNINKEKEKKKGAFLLTTFSGTTFFN